MGLREANYEILSGANRKLSGFDCGIGRITGNLVPRTNPLVGDRRRFRRGLSEPGFETRLAESCVIAGNECPLTQLHAVVTRVRVSDNLARIIACG